MKRPVMRWSLIASALIGVGTLASGNCYAQKKLPGSGGGTAPGDASGGTATPPAAGGGQAGGPGGEISGITITPKKPPSGSENAPGAPGAPGAGKGGLPGAAGGTVEGGPPGAGGAMGSGPGAAVKHDYKTPAKGAESFLAAVKSRNIDDVIQALAKRSEFEAKPEKQGMFKGILHKEPEGTDYVGQLATEFEGMSVMDMNNFKSSASVGVIVGKKTDSGQINRTLTMRHEKDGWKVQDYGRPIEFQSMRSGSAKKKK